MSSPVDSIRFTVLPQPPNLTIRHKSSLEHILNFSLSSPAPLKGEAEEALLLYNIILDSCKAANIILPPPTTVVTDDDLPPIGEDEDEDNDCDVDSNVDSDIDSGIDTATSTPAGSVFLHKLFRSLYKYCPTDSGRINLVRLVLHGLFSTDDHTTPSSRSLTSVLPLARRWLNFTQPERIAIYDALTAIAKDFLEGFFLPLTAQSRCTPSVSSRFTPSSISHPSSYQGTANRLSNLRSLVIRRDNYRCVVSGQLDKDYLKRLITSGRASRKRAGCPTEAAHIIPHSLNTVHAPGDALSAPKHYVWTILNMFDPGFSSLLEGPNIDTPCNALMLATPIHSYFGKLECYFEEATETPHTYTFKMARGAASINAAFAPKSKYITLANHEREGAIKSELPSPRLLAMHRAYCLMLCMSGAAEYVERLVRDAEEIILEGVLRADGSSNLGRVLRLRGLWGEREPEEPQPEVKRELRVGVRVQ